MEPGSKQRAKPELSRVVHRQVCLRHYKQKENQKGDVEGNVFERGPKCLTGGDGYDSRSALERKNRPLVLCMINERLSLTSPNWW